MDINQIYSTAQDNPNSPLVTPMNGQINNVFISQNNESLWRWSVPTQVWLPSGNSSQFLFGSGPPTTPPPSQNTFALYYDQDNGILYPWKISGHCWILQ